MTTPDSQDNQAKQERDPVSDRESLLAAAVAEFHDRRVLGEPVGIEEFCRRHPRIEEELRQELQTIDRMDEIIELSEAPDETGKKKETLPERLSGHRILSEIGSGGMGRVLLGIDESLGRTVAIKMLAGRYQGDRRLRDRFMQEARAMARLSHPNMVRIYSLGQPDEAPHFVMEYVEGAPLTEAAKALTLRQKVELMHKVVLAVDFLHQHQIIHRDLKPANILVTTDLEPKVLDFGLAQRIDDDGRRLTLAGEVMGTPDYFSPEQARAAPALDARSDIFSLGTILYQLCTGSVPFRGETYSEQVQLICEQDPVLPRRLNSGLPGDVQNICLKALEKNPADRYGSARDMADDLARFLAGEPVLADPSSYSRIMAGKIEQHLRELEGWRQDRILSPYEFDSFRKLYDRLSDREDAWILEVRRLSLSQVVLYLGAWTLIVGALLVVLFRHADLSGTPAVLLVAGATAPVAWLGIRCWKRGRFRIAIAYLLAFCLLAPTVMLTATHEWGLLTGYTRNNEELEFFALFPMFHVEIPAGNALPDAKAAETVTAFQGTTNAQLWWALLLSLPAYLWLRRFTGASVFSLVFAVMGAFFCLATLLRMGLIDWVREDRGELYFYLVLFALLFFALAAGIERAGLPGDSRYFYPIAVFFTFVAFSGLAGFHEQYAARLKSALPFTRGQLEYLFIINAGIYLLLQGFSERSGTAQMRSVSRVFRFVIPGHVMTSLLLLGLEASRLWHESPMSRGFKVEARFFEILLPVVACLFVFGSVPKQMKNFFATGLLFLAIGIVRLQRDLFNGRALWPLSLLAAGLLLMYTAANYTPLVLTLSRMKKRKKPMFSAESAERRGKHDPS